LEKARLCVFQANYHLIWATKYRRKVLVASVKDRLEELLKMIAEQNGCRLLALRPKFFSSFQYLKKNNLRITHPNFPFKYSSISKTINWCSKKCQRCQIHKIQVIAFFA
jgi:hypothetical protein